MANLRYVVITKSKCVRTRGFTQIHYCIYKLTAENEPALILVIRGDWWWLCPKYRLSIYYNLDTMKVYNFTSWVVIYKVSCVKEYRYSAQRVDVTGGGLRVGDIILLFPSLHASYYHFWAIECSSFFFFSKILNYILSSAPVTVYIYLPRWKCLYGPQDGRSVNRRSRILRKKTQYLMKTLYLL